MALVWPYLTVHHITLHGQPLAYQLKRSARRSIGFVINDHGLTVTAPTWLPHEQVEHAIQKKQRWIRSRLADWQQRQHTPLTWTEGSILPFLGREVRLQLASPLSAPMLDADHTILHLGLSAQASQQHIRTQLQTWLRQQASHLFAERLEHYAKPLGMRPSAFALSSAKTRWGSCTSAGTIRLNWRLIHLPLPLIDYVVAHELAHLKEMNHSPRFWQTVAALYPSYEQARRTLKQQSMDRLLLL